MTTPSGPATNADQDKTAKAAMRPERLGRPRMGMAKGNAVGPAGIGPRPQSKERLALRALPRNATLRDVVKAVLGERPVGHAHTYANVELTQRALARLAQLMAGHPFAPWEPPQWPGERSEGNPPKVGAGPGTTPRTLSARRAPRSAR